MSIPTPMEFWQITQGNIDNKSGINLEDAYVDHLDGAGKPVLRFTGEASVPANRKSYPYMKHYVPASGDRVKLINGVIIGGWRP